MKKNRISKWSTAINLRKLTRNSFQIKILFVSLCGVLFSIFLSGLIFNQGLNKLAEDTSNEIEYSLGAASHQYLNSQVQGSVEILNLWMGHPQADLRVLAEINQRLIDHRQEFRPLIETMAEIPFFADKMQHYSESGFSQNTPDKSTVVTVQTIYHDENDEIKPYPRQIIAETAILDLFMPAIHAQGADKLWTYFVGDTDASFMRMTPWTDYARNSLEVYPEALDISYWDFYPGLVEAFETWVQASDPGNTTYTTGFAPYTDGQTGDLVQTFAYPLWNRERTGFAGAVWYDISLNNIIEKIEEIELAETGFAFLTQADTNIFAIPERGIPVLGMEEAAYYDEYQTLYRYLSDSNDPVIAALSLPQDNAVTTVHLQLTSGAYVLTMQRLAPVYSFSYDSQEIQLEAWTLCFLVPDDEIYAPLIAAQTNIAASLQSILMNQAVVLVIVTALLIVLVFFFTGQVTRGLAKLSTGAIQIAQGDFDIRLDDQSTDEIGRLGSAFNEMAHQLEDSFGRLEEMVEERTRELRETQEELVHQEKLAVLGQLAGGVGHELRNPLGVIKNAAYFLKMVITEPDPKTAEILDIINWEVANTERIINDLLEFARTRLPSRHKITINDVIQETLARIEVPEHIAVMSKLQDDLPLIMADPGQLDQIFSNIIENGLQAMTSSSSVETPEGGQLTIETRLENPEWLAVTIADTGVGISPNTLAKIFQPLFTTKAKGIGFGLAIAKTLVEGHGGTITAESEGVPGKGSRFTVRLPLQIKGEGD